MDRPEFLVGAEALGLNTELKPIHPQQWRLADTLQARDDAGIPAFSLVGVCIPRRASKTTTILAVLLGRCLNREDYRVAFTAQSGTKARERFLEDLVTPLERNFDPASAPFRILRGGGQERIRFDNGSIIRVLPPIPDSFRGDAYDAVFIDEAQEHGEDLAQDLLSAILPTFDTRKRSQLIVAGTTGISRSGLLWNTLVQGRDRAERTGIVEYAAPDTMDPDTYLDEELWQRVHPGIGTLTDLVAIRRNARSLTPGSFLREYLGVWPAVGISNFVDQVAWTNAGSGGELPQPPDQFALAFAIHPNQDSASVAAAWREDGVACVMLLDHRPGTAWVAERVASLTRTYRTTAYFDDNAMNRVESERLGRMKPKPRMQIQNWKNVSTAAGLFMRELADGRLRHWKQPRLDEATRIVIKRSSPGGAWAFGRPTPEHDITPLEAASIALRAFDEKSGRQTLRPITAT